MRVPGGLTILALFSTLSCTTAVQFAELLRFNPSTLISRSATPGSKQCLHGPSATQMPNLGAVERLEIRQAPAPGPVSLANPIVPPSTNPVSSVVTSAPLSDFPQSSVSITVVTQWGPEVIEGSVTWALKTFTQTFKLIGDVAAPTPGKGEIGMGTLTEKAEKTSAITTGAAETNRVDVGLAVGLGIVAGLVGGRGL